MCWIKAIERTKLGPTVLGEIRLVTIFVMISINPYSTATIFTIENVIENVTISIEVHARQFQWIIFDYTKTISIVISIICGIWVDRNRYENRHKSNLTFSVSESIINITPSPNSDLLQSGLPILRGRRHDEWTYGLSELNKYMDVPGWASSCGRSGQCLGFMWHQHLVTGQFIVPTANC